LDKAVDGAVEEHPASIPWELNKSMTIGKQNEPLLQDFELLSID
jgi:hypothetical protein